jgi:hypothetical protein
VTSVERKESNEAATAVPVDEQISRDPKEPGANVGGLATKSGPGLPRSTEGFGMQIFGFRSVGRSNV